jgi:hypothetical protein
MLEPETKSETCTFNKLQIQNTCNQNLKPAVKAGGRRQPENATPATRSA